MPLLRSERPTRLRRTARVVLTVVLTLAVGLAVVFHTELFLSSLDVGELGSEGDADDQISALVQGHGDPAGWKRRALVELRLRGTVPFAPARLAFGLHSTDVELTLQFEPSNPGRYAFTLRDGVAVSRGEVDTRGERDGLGLLLDSVRHLFELPFVAGQIPIRRGLSAADGTTRRAFFTWGTGPQPSPQHDQIVLFERGGRLVRMDTTGRDIAPFIVARVEFRGAVALGDHRLPARATVLDAGSGRDVIHRWELVSVRELPR